MSELLLVSDARPGSVLVIREDGSVKLIRVNLSLGGSLRSVGGKAEAGGPRQTISNLETMDLAVSNRFLLLPEDDTLGGLRITNPTADATVSLILGWNGWDQGYEPIGLRLVPGDIAQTIIWPDNVPPDPADFPSAAGQYLPLAFDRIGSSNTWLGYYGKVHRSA